MAVQGLVSDEHPILKLFVSKVPRARWTKNQERRLKAGDTKARVEDADSKLLALDCPYVEVNKHCCGVLRVDVDRPLGEAELRAFCAAEDLPLPNIMVGYVDPDGRFRNPHLFWLLAESVPMTSRAPRFARLYRGVLSGLTAAFIPVGADPGGAANAHRVKNPVSPFWGRAILAPEPFALDELRTRVNVTLRPGDLREMAREHACNHNADHPDPVIAAQSNRVFDELRFFAYGEVQAFRDQGRSETEFTDHVLARAVGLFASERHQSPWELDEITRTAHRVARWTWTTYRPKRAPVKRTKEEVVAVRAKGGCRGAATQKAQSIAKIVDVALELAIHAGERPDKRTVIDTILARKLCSRRTVERRWPEVDAALADWGRRRNVGWRPGAHADHPEAGQHVPVTAP
ncbi:MAG: replication initiation protein [Acetobacteraceae bacterium]|nr:replication initiation protein [Acetobacteraceae bacterium]